MVYIQTFPIIIIPMHPPTMPTNWKLLGIAIIPRPIRNFNRLKPVFQVPTFPYTTYNLSLGTVSTTTSGSSSNALYFLSEQLVSY